MNTGVETDVEIFGSGMMTDGDGSAFTFDEEEEEEASSLAMTTTSSSNGNGSIQDGSARRKMAMSFLRASVYTWEQSRSG